MSSPRLLRRRLAFFWSVSGIFFIALLAKMIFSWFTIQEVVCRLDSGQTCPDRLRDALSIFKSKSLFFTKIEETVNPGLSTAAEGYTLVRYTKQLPQTIIFVFMSDAPLYKLNRADSFWLVTQQGFITPLTAEATGQSPLITIQLLSSSSIETTKLDPSLHQPLALLVQESARLELPLTGVEWYSPDFIVLRLADYPQVILTIESLKTSLTQLTAIRKGVDLPTVDASIRELDLRYKLPVLRTTLTSFSEDSPKPTEVSPLPASASGSPSTLPL